MGTITIDNRELNFVEQGRGNQQTVVLLHGFCGSTEYWKKMMAPLSSKYHVIAMDLRGHGKSSFDGEAFEMEDIARDVKVLLDTLEIDTVHLFGHSLGGYVTLAFAENYPNRLKSYGLIHSTAYPDTDEGKAGRLKAIEKIQDLGIHAFIDGLIPNLFAADYKLVNEEEVLEVKEIGYKTDPLAAMETLAAMRKRPDRNAVIDQQSFRFLLVQGKFDKVVPADRAVRSSAPHVTVKVLDAGHMGMLENPEELHSLLTDFIDSSTS
ncbi:alpha/beta fold hydrolase [Bacillus sp. Au-Bac7]|uniref:alpha/beta fold hydrolase n=1 Tax=Bacillus sp. Au-Bac7 TaxID=2906458 RepID=UPI001E4834ED|nr:alpha/beta hydrolase [Bacillus sp. Au-Bac7]MCE4047255.1 alpha/beta hydrolase [Bacillus sp. Au-Bac7]